MDYDFLLKGLIEAAKNPLAFIAYLLVVISWLINKIYNGKLNAISKNITNLPENDRLAALVANGLRPKEGLTSTEYLIHEKRKYYFLAFIGVILAFVIFLGLYFYKATYVLKNNVERQTLDLAFTTFIKGTTSADNKKWESSISYIENSVEMHPSYGAYINLANIYDEVGNSGAALKYSKKAMRLKPLNPSPYMKIGMYYSDLDNSDSAEYYLKKCLNVYKKTGTNDEEFLVCLLGNLGNIYIDRADLENNITKKKTMAYIAIPYYQKALSYKSEIQGTKYLGMLLGNAANAYRIIGDYRTSRLFIDESIAIKEKLLEKTQENISLGYAYLYAGNLYFDTANIEKARKFYKKAGIIFAKSNNDVGKGLALIEEGKISYKLNDILDAKTKWQLARDIFLEKGLSTYVRLVDSKLDNIDK